MAKPVRLGHTLYKNNSIVLSMEIDFSIRFQIVNIRLPKVCVSS